MWWLGSDVFYVQYLVGTVVVLNSDVKAKTRPVFLLNWLVNMIFF